MKIAILGHMGRDEAVVERLVRSKNNVVHVIGQWRNPGLVDKAQASGGEFHLVDSIANVQAVADLVQAIKPDMFLTNFDDALAAGIVDVLQERVAAKTLPALLIPCPDRAAARVEWDKFFLRELIDEIDPKYNPENFMVESGDAAVAAITHFEQAAKEVVIKPRNLTGGKGVKVMGKHLASYDAVKEYALQVMADEKQTGLEVQERLSGHEFTLQLFTDGITLVQPPATYDYPYREDGDVGPGTGGMGTFSMAAGTLLPFLAAADYDEAVALMGKLLLALKQKQISYKGVLYPTFFKTADGIRIVEINARGGDPEFINIVDLMEDDTDLVEVFRQVATGQLQADSVRYQGLATAMVYLVAPEYSYSKGPVHEFGLDRSVIEKLGCNIRFAAAERIEGTERYRTVGSSRTVGLSALGATPWEARAKIQAAITQGFDQPLSLAYRQQVADQAYISAMAS